LQAIVGSPEYAAGFDAHGIAYFRNEDYDHAISDYNQAIKLDPNNAAYYNHRGLAYNANEDYDHAISDYNQAIKLDPNNATYYDNRGLAYYGNEDNEHAISDYNQAIKLDPNNAAYYNNRGIIYIAERDYDHAVQDFSKAIALQKAEPLGYWNRARAELYLDKFGAAADDLAVVSKLAPTFPKAVIWLHIVRMRAGENDAGEYANLLKLAQNIWPGPIFGLFLGSVTPDAVRAAAQAADDPDQLCDTDFYIGIYQGAKGDRDGARQSFQSAEHSCSHGTWENEAAKVELTRLH
jgi:lipoprotein NlpI